MARHQNKLNNLTRCKYAFKHQRKIIELVEELSIKAQDTILLLSFENTFYFMGKTRVYSAIYHNHKIAILINENAISFDLGNHTAFSRALDKANDKDFEEFINKVKELYLWKS